MKNYKIYVAYQGTRYNGWQRQKNTDNTICQKLEDILEKMSGSHVDVVGSGRTDAGVHAYCQVANFHCDTSLDIYEIRKYFNDYLPNDIRVLEVKIASDRFHSRLNATRKLYVYRIDNNSVHDVFNRNFSYQIDAPLFISKMKEAANLLVGQHDFRGFSVVKTKKSTIREIYSIIFSEYNGILEITFEANGFLHNMVRILTGTLVDIGLGKMKPNDISIILDQKNRALAGHTAPPEGLFLKSVIY